jgi:hypothetical protein
MCKWCIFQQFRNYFTTPILKPFSIHRCHASITVVCWFVALTQKKTDFPASKTVPGVMMMNVPGVSNVTNVQINTVRIIFTTTWPILQAIAQTR